MVLARTFLCWVLLLLPGILVGVHGQRCIKRFLSCEKKNGICHATIEKRCGRVVKGKEVLSWNIAKSELSKFPRMKQLSEACDRNTCKLKMVQCPWSEWKPDTTRGCKWRTRMRCCHPKDGERNKAVCSGVKEELQERGCPPTTTQTAKTTHDYHGTTHTAKTHDYHGTTRQPQSLNLRTLYVTTLISLACLLCLTGIMGLYRIYLHVCHKNE